MGEENDFERLKKRLEAGSYKIGKRMEMISVEYTEIGEDKGYIDTVRESEEQHISTMSVLEREAFYSDMLFWMPADVRLRLDELGCSPDEWTKPKDDMDRRMLEYLWRVCMIERRLAETYEYQAKDEAIRVLRALQGQTAGRLRRVHAGSEPGPTTVYHADRLTNFYGFGGGALGFQKAEAVPHVHQHPATPAHIFTGQYLVASPEHSFAEHPMHTTR